MASILSHAIAATYPSTSWLHGLDLGCSFTAPLVYKEATARRIHLRLGHSIRIPARVHASVRIEVQCASVPLVSMRDGIPTWRTMPGRGPSRARQWLSPERGYEFTRGDSTIVAESGKRMWK